MDKFYFCDFSAKKEDSRGRENRAMEICLKALRQKSQKVRKAQTAKVFRKKKAPEKVQRGASKNSRELNIYRDDSGAKSFKETLTLKSFLKNKVKYKALKTEGRLPRKLNRTEVRKSSMLTRQNKELLQESLRKYLPKGFKKMKKKRTGALNSTKTRAQEHSQSVLSRESRPEPFFKSGKARKRGKPLLQYPKSQKQMKLDSLIHASRRTGLTGQEDSGLEARASKEKSLPKIGVKGSQKNISQFYSKRYLEKTKTEYDYLGSERQTEQSKFEVSRLSHGSMISNRLKKKVCIKKRPKDGAKSVAKKKGAKGAQAKAITAKKKKFEKKKYFRSENPHLKTAPDMARKYPLVPKENSVFRNRKDVSIPKHLIRHLKSNKLLGRARKPAAFKTLPKTSKKPRVAAEGTLEGNFGIFDFSAKPPGEAPLVGKEVRSYDSLTRLFSQNPKKGAGKGKKRAGYSSSSLKKQRLPSGLGGAKKYTRGSAFTLQKAKTGKVRLGTLGNPFKGKKKAQKGLSSKFSSQKLRHLKNLTIETFSPKNGFFKQKLLKNWTDKNKSRKAFFNDSMNNYFRVAGALEPPEAPTQSVGKAKGQGKLPQQVYNNIRMGDSNVKNKFIINIAHLQHSNSSNPKKDSRGKKYFDGINTIEKEIKQMLKF